MCRGGWQVSGGRQVPQGDGLFVQDEVDSTSRVATFVRADRLEKIIMLTNIRDGQKMGHICVQNRGLNGTILANDCHSIINSEVPYGAML